MVGANYMGGKRNTARAKSKDLVGRAQRRHFGRQRLTSALCATQETRVHPSVSSVSSEITLAHARGGAGTGSVASAISSIKVVNRDRSYSTTLPNNTSQHNKPSKVLSALDTLDHMSMRAAVDRILQQPNLVGIDSSKQKKAPHVLCMQPSVAIGRPTDSLFDPEVSGTQRPEMVPKHVLNAPISYSQISKFEHANLPNANTNPRHGSYRCSVLSPSDSLSTMCDVKPWVALDDLTQAEAHLFTGTNPFLCTAGSEIEKANTLPGAVDSLPRSSPFPSDSQSSDKSILSLHTSPQTTIRSGPSDHHFEEDEDCVGPSSLCSIHQPSESFSMEFGTVRVDEAQFAISSLFTSSDEEGLELERDRATCCDGNCTFPSIGNDKFLTSYPSEYGHDSISVWASQEVTENDAPSGISIDFLSDPQPWETIGRILKLKSPEPSVVQSVRIGLISFTKDREGVGYVSPRTCNPCSLDAASSETSTEDKSLDNIRAASSLDPAGVEVAELGAPSYDGSMADDSPNPRYTSNSTRPLFDEPSATTRGGIDPYSHVHPLEEVFPTPVIRCALNEQTRSSFPLTNVVGTTVAELDVDTPFDGPCLFGDSDLEEDE